MSELTSISARVANQRFSELLSRVESEGQGFIVTKHGRPVARILPIEKREAGLTSEHEAALERVLTTGWDLGIGKFSRDELYDR